MLKVSIAYSWGYKAVGTWSMRGPTPTTRRSAADRILRQRLADLGLEFDQILTEFVGVDATPRPPGGPDPGTCPRCSSASACAPRTRRAVERFTREIAPLVLTGPPSVTGSPAAAPRSKRSSPTGRR